MNKRKKDYMIAKELGWRNIVYSKVSGLGTAPGRGTISAIPTYASDPSPPTEWEIMQWASKQEMEGYLGAIHLALHDIMCDRFCAPKLSYEDLSYAFLYSIELGDWANALLEVLDGD